MAICARRAREGPNHGPKAFKRRLLWTLSSIKAVKSSSPHSDTRATPSGYYRRCSALEIRYGPIHYGVPSDLQARPRAPVRSYPPPWYGSILRADIVRGVSLGGSCAPFFAQGTKQRQGAPRFFGRVYHMGPCRHPTSYPSPHSSTMKHNATECAISYGHALRRRPRGTCGGHCWEMQKRRRSLPHTNTKGRCRLCA